MQWAEDVVSQKVTHAGTEWPNRLGTMFWGSFGDCIHPGWHMINSPTYSLFLSCSWPSAWCRRCPQTSQASRSTCISLAPATSWVRRAAWCWCALPAAPRISRQVCSRRSTSVSGRTWLVPGWATWAHLVVLDARLTARAPLAPLGVDAVLCGNVPLAFHSEKWCWRW